MFVLNQEASLFHTDERIALVKAGVQDLSNVIVVNGGAYIISYLTFPAYFLKHNDSAIDYQTSIDVRLFKYKIASVLGITSRYVGSEPLSHTTNLYNQKLISELNPQIEVHVIQRKLAAGDLGVISARTVREAIDKGDETVWQKMVPETTQHFISNNLLELQQRIRKDKRLMEIKKTAIAGTLESSDVQIMLSKGTVGVEFDLVSDVAKQFADDIKLTIKETLGLYGIENAVVKVVDKGALDMVIKARTLTAIQEL